MQVVSVNYTYKHKTCEVIIHGSKSRDKKAIKRDGLEKFLLDQGIEKKSIDISKLETAQAGKV